jgi:hypothetical protein
MRSLAWQDHTRSPERTASAAGTGKRRQLSSPNSVTTIQAARPAASGRIDSIVPTIEPLTSSRRSPIQPSTSIRSGLRETQAGA